MAVESEVSTTNIIATEGTLLGVHLYEHMLETYDIVVTLSEIHKYPGHMKYHEKPEVLTELS